MTFTPNRKVKCKSSFVAGGPGSPLSDSGSRSAARCPDAANPGDGVGTPLPPSPPSAQRRGPGRSAEGGRGAPVRSERGGWPASRRVQVHARGWSPRLCERVLPRSAPSREFSVPRRSRDPCLGPPSRAEPPAWGPTPGALLPGHGPRRGAVQEQRGASAWKRSPTSSPRCSGAIWNRQEMARTPIPRLCSQASLC